MNRRLKFAFFGLKKRGRFLDSDLHFAGFLCWKRLLNKLPEFVNSRLVIVYKNIYLNIWDLHYK